MSGVERRMLDRVGAEVARATSIVRYAPGSHFSPHVHDGGEEFLVLEGVFQDEHGDFPAGSYIRNPVGSRHQPGSDAGCTLFVKLWQFQPDDCRHVRIHTEYQPAVPHRDFPGVAVQPLYQDDLESVCMMTLEAGAGFSSRGSGGAELLVIAGTLSESGDRLNPGDWLRTPVNRPVSVIAGDTGARVWIKTGHLSRIEAQIKRMAQ